MIQKIYSVLFIIWFYIIYIKVKILTVCSSIIPSRKNKSGILYLELFGPPSAGYRYRSKQWADYLNDNGIRAEIKYLISYEEYKRLSKTPTGIITFHFKALTKRFLQCLNAGRYQVIIVRRELLMYNDYGNLFFEKWLRKKHSILILDADDDIAAAKREPRQRGLFGKLLLEHPQKFTQSLNYYDGFILGSSYLQEQLTSYNPSIGAKKKIVIPTCVNYDHQPVKSYSEVKQKLTLGWAGASYNLINLALIIPYLEQLSKEYPITLLVICDEPFVQNASFEVVNIKWNEENEISNLLQIDIGLMPLTHNPENMGKSGLKLVQYMGLGIVSVASSYSVNKIIIENGMNGFLVANEAEWASSIKSIIQRTGQFAVIGAKARETILSNYSFNSSKEQYLNFICNIVEQNKA